MHEHMVLRNLVLHPAAPTVQVHGVASCLLGSGCHRYHETFGQIIHNIACMQVN